MAAPHRSRRRLPARVYWFRRALVLSVLAAPVVGVTALVDEPADEETGSVTARTVGEQPVALPGRPVSSGPSTGARDPRSSDGKTDRRRKRTPKPLPEPDGPCVHSDVVVTPTVPGTAYAGSRVRIRLEIGTVSTPACTWQVSPRTVAVKVVSGGDRIWSSQDCPAAVPTVEVVARKREPAVVDMGWHGQRSDSDCSRTTPWALPGWYHVQAAAFGAEPADVQFELRTPVPETITPKPEPDRDGKRQGRD